MTTAHIEAGATAVQGILGGVLFSLVDNQAAVFWGSRWYRARRLRNPAEPWSQRLRGEVLRTVRRR